MNNNELLMIWEKYNNALINLDFKEALKLNNIIYEKTFEEYISTKERINKIRIKEKLEELIISAKLIQKLNLL